MLGTLCLLATEISTWPDPVDVAVLVGYLLIIVGVPLVGYVLMAVDIRAHYRRLRGALVVVSNYVVQMPAWVVMDAHRRRKAPACLAAFGLNFPCSEAELL